MGRLSTPTVSSVPGEYNYFSAGAKVIITAGASGYCTCIRNHGEKITGTSGQPNGLRRPCRSDRNGRGRDG